MCGTCGCGEEDHVSFTKPGEKHTHLEGNHVHDHLHEHDYHHDHRREIQLELDVLTKNNLSAERNRGFMEALHIISLNLVSSPGSGKTALLEATIKDMIAHQKMYIIEGDQQTMNDANRIDKAGAPVIQVNTGNGCHLDADMVNHALKQLQPEANSLVFIENVGNLVCPSLFDLGETKRVVVISVTEGQDKPIKYPTMFETSQLCIINKIDLLPYVDFDVEQAKKYALQVNPDMAFMELSAITGEGMANWENWLGQLMENHG
jgi:hydrogenase nickel incorporation protein HypB